MSAGYLLGQLGRVLVLSVLLSVTWFWLAQALFSGFVFRYQGI